MNSTPGQYVKSPYGRQIYRVMSSKEGRVHLRNTKLGDDMLADEAAVEYLWDVPTEDEIAKAMLLGQMDQW
jgi:hypothetical protein